MMKLFLTILAAGVASSVVAGEFHVSPSGADSNGGTLAKPFLTLQRAQAAARTLAGREAVTIFVHAGTYYLPATLIFSAEDSGSKSTPVVYQAFCTSPGPKHFRSRRSLRLWVAA